MKLEHRIALIGVAAAAVAGFVYSQIYIHEKNRKEIREVAAELAFTWQNQLHLSDEQASMLEDTIIEYTIKKNEIINSSLGIGSQIQKLKSIQGNEHKALQKFMSEEQFESYLAMNKKITRKS
ncbi:MAG: hypothetical protein VX712_10025 [Bacteroidota bacterium]|uniref:Uncharacterized protein n=1 Tax=Christiangramia flava JLT2011 TaxID=1229726 RepID=A0A1L7I9H1_9FLAO|nr:hypothetical protein [Christiangramia flava]APU70261.1 hypothetical protein GRFL_3537 [Christiangramia flava JLT2011]MAM20096.1 hypothetical protein [Christiangramia sp.]MEE2772544.1 hypothetical protein [Bacteroidota bacterium]OSS39747.1 secreted protein [Christiangramia flava JLT2011]